MGKGPNQSVENSRRANTARLEGSREARTVDPESAAVNESVEGSWAFAGG